MCPECNHHICNVNTTNSTNIPSRFNRCCGSRFRYNYLNPNGSRHIICIICGFYSESLDRQECNCGYCNACNCYVNNIDRHSCVQLQEADVTTQLEITMDDLNYIFSEDRLNLDLEINHYRPDISSLISNHRNRILYPLQQLRYRPTIRSNP
jgi:hypothetical protein